MLVPSAWGEADVCSLCDRGGLAGWNQTLVTTLEHQLGGSCDLGERPGEPGVQGQHCLSTEEFRPQDEGP